MPVITLDMIFNELMEVRKELHSIKEKAIRNSIEDVSLNKVCKMLHRGPDTIIEFVKNGELKAKTYKNKAGEARYRFRLADIFDFQEKDTAIIDDYEIMTAEELAKQIFKH